MSRQYVKDNAKHLGMKQLNALLAHDGLGESCEYDMETLWDRKSELAERQAEAQFDAYMASLEAQANHAQSEANRLMDLAIKTKIENGLRFGKFSSSASSIYTAKRLVELSASLSRSVESYVWCNYLDGEMYCYTSQLGAYLLKDMYDLTATEGRVGYSKNQGGLYFYCFKVTAYK